MVVIAKHQVICDHFYCELFIFYILDHGAGGSVSELSTIKIDDLNNFITSNLLGEGSSKLKSDGLKNVVAALNDDVNAHLTGQENIPKPQDDSVERIPNRRKKQEQSSIGGKGPNTSKVIHALHVIR